MNKSGFVEVKHSALEILIRNTDTVLIKSRESTPFQTIKY